MRQTRLVSSLVAISALLAACGSVPKTTSLLERSHTDYAAAQSNPNVTRYAPLELKQAGDALRHADSAAGSYSSSAADIDKLAYVAVQKIALAQEAAKQRAAEASVTGAIQERDRMRLEQRTLEADRARMRAEQSAQAANAASAQALQAQREAQLAQREAAEAQRTRQEAQAQAARLEAQLADLSAQQTARGLIVTLGDVLFTTGQARLSADGVRKARKLADVLIENPGLKVAVEGHTDSTGSVARNQELSERRALAVRDALQRLGIGPERVAVRGYGPDYPVAPNDTAENRQLNRRVEIVLSDSSGKISQR